MMKIFKNNKIAQNKKTATIIIVIKIIQITTMIKRNNNSYRVLFPRKLTWKYREIIKF